MPDRPKAPVPEVTREVWVVHHANGETLGALFSEEEADNWRREFGEEGDSIIRYVPAEAGRGGDAQEQLVNVTKTLRAWMTEDAKSHGEKNGLPYYYSRALTWLELEGHKHLLPAPPESR